MKILPQIFHEKLAVCQIKEQCSERDQEAGLKIFEDIAIVGFDDILLTIHTSPPPPVRQPMRLQGQIAAETLRRRFESEDDLDRSEKIIDCELIIRGSTVSLKK